MILSVLDIRIAAIYRLAVKRQLDRATVSKMLLQRANLSVEKSRVLAGHWFTTEALRGNTPFRLGRAA